MDRVVFGSREANRVLVEDTINRVLAGDAEYEAVVLRRAGLLDEVEDTERELRLAKERLAAAVNNADDDDASQCELDVQLLKDELDAQSTELRSVEDEIRDTRATVARLSPWHND